MDSRIVLIAARTARAIAYLQAFANAGIRLSGVVLYGKKEIPPVLSVRSARSCPLGEVFIPDLSGSFEESVCTHCVEALEVEAQSVNDPAVLSALMSLRADLLVYSGSGGQIVGESILGLGVPVLHSHSGRLPEYRGSTTLYYSWLREGLSSVSVMVLSRGIDTGEILLQRDYAIPPRDVEVDYLYDSAIRANALVSVIEEFLSEGVLPDAVDQDESRANVYYIIHPLLKHLALLLPERRLISE